MPKLVNVLDHVMKRKQDTDGATKLLLMIASVPAQDDLQDYKRKCHEPGTSNSMENLQNNNILSG